MLQLDLCLGGVRTTGRGLGFLELSLGGRELRLRGCELPLGCRDSIGEGLKVVSQLLSDVGRSGGGYDNVVIVVKLNVGIGIVFGVVLGVVFGLRVVYRRIVLLILNCNRVKGS